MADRNLLVVLTLSSFGICFSQDWSDSYMEAYKTSHAGGGYSYGKDDGMYGMSDFEQKVSSLKPIFAILTAVAKILLKITIFKMLIKFAAIICLLFFIPWLKIPDLINGEPKGSSENEDARMYDMIERVSQKYERLK